MIRRLILTKIIKIIRFERKNNIDHHIEQIHREMKQMNNHTLTEKQKEIVRTIFQER